MDQQATLPDTHCPRCGYDLRGAIDTWQHECPMWGVCTECGLEFEWGELLSPQRNMPRWCVEYARGWGGWTTVFKTLLVLFFRPRKFWRDLKMVHEPQWKRNVLLVVISVLFLYPVFAGSVGWQVYQNSINASNTFGIGIAPIKKPPHVAGGWAMLLPFSKQSNRVNWPARFRQLDRTIPNSVSRSFEIPFSLQSIRVLRKAGRLYELRSYRFLHVITMHFIIVAALSSLSFITLPISIRKAQVRWSHLLRIQLYSLSLLSVPLAAYVVVTLTRLHLPFISRLTFAYLIWLVSFGLFVTWWSLAAKHYLKLPHAWGVGVSMVVLAYAGGLFIVSLIDFVMI